MSGLRTSKDLCSVIFLRESLAGRKPLDVPESPQLDLFGQVLAPVKTSVVPESKKGSRVAGTSGPPSTISSASATLNSSLASRLKTRCATVGSTVYTQTWKERVTPAGLSYWEHTARAPTTSGKGYTGWPTPNTPSGGPNATSTPNHTGGMDLEGAASLAGWPTPKSEDSEQTGGHRGTPDTLHSATQLAGWKTPHATDGVGGVMEIRPDADGHYKLRDQAALAGWGTPRVTTNSGIPCPDHTGKGSRLEDQAALVGWASPASRDYKDTPGMAAAGVNPDGSERSRLGQLPRQASLAISGPTPDPTSAKTASGGVLNPAFSRWLQSYPAAWDTAAILAWRNMSIKRRKPASCA